MKKNIVAVVISALCVFNCFAWGQKGHDTVAFIAEQHLTDKAKHAVDSILAGKSMVYWSNWLDNASHTPEYAYTKTWHYKNIDAGVEFEAMPLNPDGDVVTGLKSQIEVLKSPESTITESVLALKIVIHLVGDMHQPMHMGHKTDLGGNRWPVKYFRRDNNLHSIWDSSLVESAHKWSYTEWQSQIDRESEDVNQTLVKGSIEDWAKETHKIATAIYDSTPQNHEISYDYIAEWTPVIEMQFLKGGLRLAYILNSIYGEK